MRNEVEFPEWGVGFIESDDWWTLTENYNYVLVSDIVSYDFSLKNKSKIKSNKYKYF